MSTRRRAHGGCGRDDSPIVCRILRLSLLFVSSAVHVGVPGPKIIFPRLWSCEGLVREKCRQAARRTRWCE